MKRKQVKRVRLGNNVDFYCHFVTVDLIRVLLKDDNLFLYCPPHLSVEQAIKKNFEANIV